MYISGTGITPQLVKVKPDYKVLTKLALQWFRAADGNWLATDRGSTSDTYESDITIAGHQDTVETVINQIEANRVAQGFTITLTGFEATEHFFGEDVSYTSITSTVLDIGPIEQHSWLSYRCKLRLRAILPSFTGSASWPVLNYVQWGIRKNIDWTVFKFDTYYGTYSYIDMLYDTGLLEMKILLTVANCQAMRRYLATTLRGGTVSIAALAGISKPYGPTRDITYPISAKVIEWSDDGWFGLTHRMMSFKLAEVA